VTSDGIQDNRSRPLAQLRTEQEKLTELKLVLERALRRTRGQKTPAPVLAPEEAEEP